MGLVIGRECVTEVRDEIGALIAAHWHEVGQDRERMKLDPDWDGYAALEVSGQLAVIAAREDGRLVGYATYIVRRHLHYRTILVAINDLLFLLPHHRAGMAGVRLIKRAEQILKEANVKKLFYGVKAWHDFGPVLKRQGYAPIETTWAKWVGA